MRPRQYVTVVSTRWRIVACSLLLGLAVAGLFSALVPKEYSTSATLFVTAPPTDGSTSAYERAQLAQQRVSSYTELATDTRVTTGVVQDLGLRESPDELSARVEAASVAESLLIRITVRDPNPALAASIVNDVADRFVGLVRELEQPASPDATADVSVELVRPAAVPTGADGLPVATVLAIGGLLGLLLGVGAAVARELIDSRVRSDRVLRRIVGAPVIGRTLQAPAGPHLPLSATEEQEPARVEALRGIRTELQYLPVDPRPACVLLASALPDEGTSATAVDLAAVLTAAGESVLVIDADLRRPQVAEHLGLEPDVGLADVLTGRVDLDRAVQQYAPDQVHGLPAGAAPFSGATELLTSARMPSLLAQARDRYDRVLLVGPPLLSVTDSAALAPQTDGVVLVCRWDHTPAELLERAVASLTAVSATVLAAIVSGAPAPRREDAYTGPRSRPTTAEEVVYAEDTAGGPEQVDVADVPGPDTEEASLPVLDDERDDTEREDIEREDIEREDSEREDSEREDSEEAPSPRPRPNRGPSNRQPVLVSVSEAER